MSNSILVIMNRAKPLVLLVSAGCMVACKGGSDSLRSTIPQQGVAATVQVDLPHDSQKATVTGTVYKNGVAQALVGGDVLQARTDQAVATLKSDTNLSGHYAGVLTMDTAETQVDVAVNYDPQASAEDRWFASEDLQVNPGPGSLVGYAVEGMQLPQDVIMDSPAAKSVYPSRSDIIQVNWAPVNEGDQVRLVAAMSCISAGKTYEWAYAKVLGIEGTDADAAGSYSVTMNELLTSAPLDMQLDNIINYIAVYTVMVGIGLEPSGALTGNSQFVTPDNNDGCDIDLSLLRERSNTLPATFSGGYAISSRSSTVRIKYAP